MRSLARRSAWLALAVAGAATAQDWSAPRALSASTSPSRLQYNWGWAIDVDGRGVVHAVWLEIASPSPPGPGGGRVMYSRSADEGRNWSPPVPLSGAPEVFTGHPKVAAAGRHVYVAWHGLHDGSGVPKIYLVHSATQGSSWDPTRILSEEAREGGAAWPSLDACGEAVHVVWGAADRGGVAEIHLRSSADAGSSWTPVRQVSSPDGRSSWVPSVACTGAAVHVAWSDERHNVDQAGRSFDCGLAGDSSACREEEYYRRSTDFGSTWEPELRLSTDPPDAPRPSWAPSIATWQDRVHVVFFDARAGRFQIFHKRSSRAGAAGSWEPERMISPDTSEATLHARPVIAAQGPELHVVWFTVTSGLGAEVRYAASRDEGASFLAPLTLTPQPSLGETHPSVAASPCGPVHVIWFGADARGIDQIVHRVRSGSDPGCAAPAGGQGG